MKRKVLLFSIICVGIIAYLIGCSKSPSPGYYACSPLPPEKDSTALLEFAGKNGIVPTKDSTGLYFEIIDTGSGPPPTLNSKIFVTYVGKLMNGATFDSLGNSANSGFILNQLILGWQIGLPKILKGGRIKLLVPSALAYGCSGSPDGRIPADTPLYFDITLVDVE